MKKRQGLLLGVMGILALLAGVFMMGPGSVQEQPISEACSEAGGEWIEETRECATRNAAAPLQEFCEAYEGEYDGCASACRNNPETDYCIEVCVQVCTI